LGTTTKKWLGDYVRLLREERDTVRNALGYVTRDRESLLAENAHLRHVRGVEEGERREAEENLRRASTAWYRIFNEQRDKLHDLQDKLAAIRNTAGGIH